MGCYVTLLCPGVGLRITFSMGDNFKERGEEYRPLTMNVSPIRMAMGHLVLNSKAVFIEFGAG